MSVMPNLGRFLSDDLYASHRDRLDFLVFIVIFGLLLAVLWVRPDVSVRADIHDLAAYKRFYDGLEPNMFGWGSLLYVFAARCAQLVDLTANQFMFVISATVLGVKACVAFRLRIVIGTRLAAFAFLAMPAFFLVDFFELRNAVSQACLLLALLFAIERKLGKSAFASLVAIGFHFSAIPFVPLILFPAAGLAVMACGIVVLGIGPSLDFDHMLTRLRGHPGAGVLGNKSGVLKVLAQSVGGYLTPIGALIYWDRRRAIGEYAPVLSVVTGSLLLFVGLWLIPSIPDALYHRSHRVGWFGVSLLLLLISSHRVLCWTVSVPITVGMFVYYAYLNLNFSGFTG